MLRHKCNICGRDIGHDAPNGMTCWTCFNKQEAEAKLMTVSKREEKKRRREEKVLQWEKSNSEAETKSTRTISKICIVCGHENPDGSINCLKCGRNIDDNYEAYKGVYYGVYKYGEKNKGKKAEVEVISRQERDKAEAIRRRAEVDAEDRRRREKNKRRRVEAERRRVKAEVEAIRKQTEETELAYKLYKEKKLSSEKILLYLKPYSNDLRRGITRPKLSNLLGITQNECKIILNKLISDGKAYKKLRFLKYSKYYVKCI